MKRILLASVILAFTSTGGMAQSKSDTTDTMKTFGVIAKATGMCGVFHQMARFQATTKLDGGDKFILRFISTEAARLGKTTQELLDICVIMPKKYEAWKKAFGITD